MGAVTEGAPDNNFTGMDRVRRYRTTCKVRVDSHRFTEPLFLSDDVKSIQLGKTVKGPGQANLSLVAHRNWLNYLAPNDVINIYFNIGDGEGWTRTFFGFIDRVEESYTVGENGSPTTVYTVMCTDFHKAFSMTQIYFNPHLSGRSDLDGAFFGTPNIGGLALQTQGVQVFGAPSDIVVNLVLLMLGFGTQYTLPSSYNALLAGKLRQNRTEFVTDRLTLSDFAREAINGGGFQALLEQIRATAQATAEDVAHSATVQGWDRGSGLEDRIKLLSAETGIDEDTLTSAAQAGSPALTELLTNHAQNREITLADPNRATNDDRGALTILNSTLSNAPPSLLDVVDPITFVERRAMDGYHAAAPVWQRQGALDGIITALSHDIVNELIYDLRPVTAPTESGDLDGNELLYKPYSRTSDDIGGNLNDEGSNETGIQYIPALVMREYPFSTIDGIELDSNAILGGRTITANSRGEQDGTFLLWFGEIWQDGPNVPGRHIVHIPNINVADQRDERSGKRGVKHLDVAVISETEITRSQLGRSDNDHFNLLEFTVDGLLGNAQKFYMHDLLPIITPIHIMRNGLRVRSLTTRFARFSVDEARVVSPQPTAEEEEVYYAAEDQPPPPPPSAVLIAPISQADNPGTRPRSTRNNVIFNNSQSSGGSARHGYRHKPNIGPAGAWVLHNGIDIAAPRGLEVRAIADGHIQASVPTGFPGNDDIGGFRRYGNIVVIKHTGIEGAPDPFYSVYAHLDEITEAGGWGHGATVTAGRRAFTARGWLGSRVGQEPLAVTQGTVIGTIGNSGMKISRRNREDNSHLHFEIDTHFPSRDDTLSPRLPYVALPPDFLATVFIQGGTANTETDTVTGATEITRAIWRRATPAQRRDQNMRVASRWNGVYRIESQRALNFGPVTPVASPKPPTPAGLNSLDPVAFYTSLDLDLVELINHGTPAVDTNDEVEPDDDDRGAPPPEEAAAQDREEAGAEEDDVPRLSSRGVAVDSSLIRKQVVRWAILNDLWFQHNLEYLNGSIEMRGAPEIRVGYRLDIVEKSMSFYVEGVNHSWSFPGRMSTSLSVTRGQPNNPFPVYILPPLNVYGSQETQRKLASSRLANYFIVPDPLAVRRGVVLRQRSDTNTAFQQQPFGIVDDNTRGNYIDSEEQLDQFDELLIEAGSKRVRIAADNAALDSVFDVQIAEFLEAGSLEGADAGDNSSGVTGTAVDNRSVTGENRGGNDA